MKRILVTGARGQLASELKLLSAPLSTHEFHFATKEDGDITRPDSVRECLTRHQYDFVINAAAYTAVDKAESERKQAFAVNATGAGHVAQVCREKNIRLIHFSTDFVFDGTHARPLSEDDSTHPLSVYGASKLEGEQQVSSRCPDAIIIRTSWLYSSFGNNFVKTILRLCRERDALRVVSDQVGSPTYARDLAGATLHILSDKQSWKPGIYHYANEGVASWYDFALAIRDMAGLKTEITPIETSEYPTPATRPAYSVLNKKKIKSAFGLAIPYWRDSLAQCMSLFK